MANITDENLDDFIKNFTPEIKRQSSGHGSIIIAWIVMAANELKGRRVGKKPNVSVPNRYLDQMIKDNGRIAMKGSKEIGQIARELRAMNRR